MIEYIMWTISFCALYISIVWINVLYFNENTKTEKIERYPTITIGVPAYNEEDSIAKTVESLLELEYPKDKLKIVIINDGSTDNTCEVCDLMNNKYSNVSVIHKKNAGKAAALNSCIPYVDTELFACVDADSYVEKDALKNMLKYFKEENTKAVISAIKVNKPKNIYEKLQKFEYIIAILSRKLMASLDTLVMTPGVLSVYKTDILKKVGMFDVNNITEDFEIALRLKYNGYNIRIAEDAITYTNVPRNFHALWRQRIRWYRGFIDNHFKYKDMFFSKDHGLMGYFQMPLNILGVAFLIAAIVLISYSTFSYIYEFLIRIFVINNYFVDTFFYIPSLREFMLSLNFKVMLPIYLSIVAGFFLFYAAHKEAGERLKNPISIWAYFFLLPYLTCLHWLGALFEHVFGMRRKW